MLDNLSNLSLTTLMVVIGPVLLAAALAYGIWRVSGRSRREKQRTDDATRDLYRRESQKERKEEGL